MINRIAVGFVTSLAINKNHQSIELEDIKQDCWCITLESYKDIKFSINHKSFIRTLERRVTKQVSKKYHSNTVNTVLDNNQLTEDNPIDAVIYLQQAEFINYILEYELSPREADILRLKSCLSGLTDVKSNIELGQLFNVTRERIRQISAKAIRKFKQRTRKYDFEFGFECFETCLRNYKYLLGHEDIVIRPEMYDSQKGVKTASSKRSNNTPSPHHATSCMVQDVVQKERDEYFEIRKEEIIDERFKPHYYDLSHPKITIEWIKPADNDYLLVENMIDAHPKLSAYRRSMNVSTIAGRVIINDLDELYIASTPYVVYGRRYHMPYIAFTYQEDGVYVNRRMWGEIEFELRKKVEERLQLNEVLLHSLQ